MEQEERDEYVKTYGEDSQEPRRIISEFTNKIGENLEAGAYAEAEVRLKALEIITKIERPTQKLLDVLEKLLPKSTSFPIWRTVKLGVGSKTGTAFTKAFTKAGMKVSDWAKDVLNRPAFTVAPEETELKLVRVTVAELGFENGATRADIYARAEEFGLDLCPAEVGPQLRLQYADQLTDEYLLVGMEPITDSDGSLNVFNVGHDDDGRWLRSGHGHADVVWRGDDQWVFVSRK